MALNNDTNFPPSGLAPYRIDRAWCLGDSLPYLNANFTNFDSRIDGNTTAIAAASATLNTAIINLSAQPRGIVLQQAYNQNSNFTQILYSDTNNRINVDVNTKLTSTQGSLFLTTAATPITPSSLNNFFKIQFTIERGYTSVISGLISILSRNINGVLDTDALYCIGSEGQGFYSSDNCTGQIRLPVTSLTPTYFQIRVGIPSYYTQTVNLNGSTYSSPNTQTLGGTRISSLIVEEIKG